MSSRLLVPVKSKGVLWFSTGGTKYDALYLPKLELRGFYHWTYLVGASLVACFIFENLNFTG
jgi:hypothetical protein